MVILSIDQKLIGDAGKYCNHKFNRFFDKMIVYTVAVYSILLSK